MGSSFIRYCSTSSWPPHASEWYVASLISSERSIVQPDVQLCVAPMLAHPMDDLWKYAYQRRIHAADRTHVVVHFIQPLEYMLMALVSCNADDNARHIWPFGHVLGASPIQNVGVSGLCCDLTVVQEPRFTELIAHALPLARSQSIQQKHEACLGGALESPLLGAIQEAADASGHMRHCSHNWLCMCEHKMRPCCSSCVLIRARGWRRRALSSDTLALWLHWLWYLLVKL